MIPALLSTLQPLMQQSPETGERAFYQQWSSLMLVLILLCIIVITAVAFLIAQRRARRRKSELPKPKDGPTIDAWEEAGRRIDDSIVEINDD